MRIVLTGVVLLMSLLVACSSGANGDESANTPSTLNNKGAAMAKETRLSKAEAHRNEIMHERYARPSTQGSYILVTIQSDTSNEIAEIVVDNETWIMTNKSLNYSGLNHEHYVKTMVEQGDKPFIVDEPTFKKLSVYKTPAPSQELRDKSIDELAEEYLQPMIHSKYMTWREGVDGDRTLIRLFLEKGCVVLTRCIDGLTIIRW